MEAEAKNLRELFERRRKEFEDTQAKLEQYESRCHHKFTDTVYDPIYHKAYTIPGDPPGTMGVDWRGPCFVPASTEDRWKRECTRCGLVQYTQSYEEEKITKRKPRWRR